jgi:hypothetical protein
MKKHSCVLLILMIWLISCKNQHSDSKKNDNNKYPKVIDSIITKIPLITSKDFRIEKTSNSEFEKNYYKLNENLKNFFYSAKGRKDDNDSNNYQSFFYGRMDSRNGLNSILIINTNYSTSVTLDCFIIDASSVIRGYFTISYLFLDQSYKIEGFCRRINDSIFILTHTDIEIVQETDSTYKEITDTTILQYSLKTDGALERIENSTKKDTITKRIIE